MKDKLPRYHRVKLDVAYYDEVISGTKTFEVRKNDRDYQVGVLIQFIPSDHGITLPDHGGEKPIFIITYILSSADFVGITPDYVVFSIKELKEAIP